MDPRDLNFGPDKCVTNALPTRLSSSVPIFPSMQWAQDYGKDEDAQVVLFAIVKVTLLLISVQNNKAGKYPQCISRLFPLTDNIGTSSSKPLFHHV